VPRTPTPVEEFEWLFSGLLPGAAIKILERDAERLEEVIRKAQIKRAQALLVRKHIEQDRWPKDDNGFLTLSDDNPMA
jgi:hypothetical protein